jgi:peptide/nickel transport system ATP-binding protein
MYLGKICEVAPSDELYHNPSHHYTKVLLDSIPVPDPEVAIHKTAIEGEIPSPVAPPPGCRFNTRCPAAQDVCRSDEPQLRAISDGHFVACHFPIETSVAITSR